MLDKDLEEGNRERAKADLKRIYQAAGKMAELLDELPQLSRVGQVMQTPRPVAVGELVSEAVDRLTGALIEHQVELIVGPDLPIVEGDRVRLLEVFQNLLENAVKFLSKQRPPRVEVGKRTDGGETVFFVRDNGIGIDPRYHQKVFGLFERLDAANEGTGVGLALVKRIVEVHGGRVWVESEGVGRGSTFCLTLPAPSRAWLQHEDSGS